MESLDFGSPPRMLKKAVQQGRSERRPEAYPLGYVEDLNDARTPLAGFLSILLGLFDRFFDQRPVGLCIEGHRGLTFGGITDDGEVSGIGRLGGLEHHK
jgi:hypothetical protein